METKVQGEKDGSAVVWGGGLGAELFVTVRLVSNLYSLTSSLSPHTFPHPFPASLPLLHLHFQSRSYEMQVVAATSPKAPAGPMSCSCGKNPAA